MIGLVGKAMRAVARRTIGWTATSPSSCCAAAGIALPTRPPRVIHEANSIARVPSRPWLIVYDASTHQDRVFSPWSCRGLHPGCRMHARALRSRCRRCSPPRAAATAARARPVACATPSPTTSDRRGDGQGPRDGLRPGAAGRRARRRRPATTIPASIRCGGDPGSSDLETSSTSTTRATELVALAPYHYAPDTHPPNPEMTARSHRGYAAPHRFAGRFSQAHRAATDQFSFCVALYEALYGERPQARLRRSGPASRRFKPLNAQGIAVPFWLREVVLRGQPSQPRRPLAVDEQLLAGWSGSPPWSAAPLRRRRGQQATGIRRCRATTVVSGIAGARQIPPRLPQPGAMPRA